MVKLRLSLVATLSGVVLGFFLKWIEATTGILVYTLLLNIDFVPVLGTINWGEFGEFIFHLFFSFALTYVYFWVIRRAKRLSHYLLISLAITTPTIFLYVPLVLLAKKQVPQLTDVDAISYWVAGHILYSLTLGILAYVTREKSSAL